MARVSVGRVVGGKDFTGWVFGFAFVFFLFFGRATRHVGSYLPNQRSNPHPLHWQANSCTMNYLLESSRLFELNTVFHPLQFSSVQSLSRVRLFVSP